MTINSRDLVSRELRYSPSLSATLWPGYTINSLMPDDHSPLIFITMKKIYASPASGLAQGGKKREMFLPRRLARVVK